MKSSELLDKAKHLLSPDVWATRSCALNGLEVVTSPTSRDAVKFNAVGAVHKAYKGPDRIKEVDAVMALLLATVPPRSSKSVFMANDELFPDHAGLMAWFDRAIHVAKIEEKKGT